MDVLLRDNEEGPQVNLPHLPPLFRLQRHRRPLPMDEENATPVSSFYDGKVVFVTGATGTLGKLLLAKLLHSFPNLRKIFILMRLRSFNQVNHRLASLFEDNHLWSLDNRWRERLQVVRGDLCLPRLGLHEDDVRQLAKEVDVVFHLGGFNMFDESSLKPFVEVNVRALRDLLELAKQFRKLQAFVHVSSLFVGANKEVLEEKFVEPLVKAQALIDFIASLSSSHRCPKPLNLAPYRNNYLFTKCVAEEAVHCFSGHLPVVIVRLPLILPSVRFPRSGYTETINSLSGLSMTMYLGLNKSVLATRNASAEVFPADYAANVLIAAAWNTARTKSLNCNMEVPKVEEKIPIYNVTTSKTNTITWGLFMNLTRQYAYLLPTLLSLSLPWTVVHSKKKLHFALITLLHYIPGYISDFFSLYLTYKTKYIGYYAKIDRLSRTFSPLMLRSWDVKVDRLRSLWSALDERDQELFEFDASAIHWDVYMRQYVRGIRQCILKDPPDTLEAARKNNAKRIVYTLLACVALVLLTAFTLVVRVA